jgi:hypothetical protein
MVSRSRQVALIADGILALLFIALTAWLLYESSTAAKASLASRGHVGHAGAVSYAVAVIYSGPVAVCFTAACFALWRHWRMRWIVHWGALFVAIAPMIVEWNGWWNYVAI